MGLLAGEGRGLATHPPMIVDESARDNVQPRRAQDDPDRELSQGRVPTGGVRARDV